MALARAQAALPAFRAACASAGQTERASSLLRELKVTLTELAVGDAAAEDVTRERSRSSPTRARGAARRTRPGVPAPPVSRRTCAPPRALQVRCWSWRCC